MSVNRVTLIGRLGKDPEQKSMPNGDAVTNATLATSENWKDKAGEKHEKTEWHNLVFYRRLAEIAEEEKPFALPQSWEWSNLATVGVINPRNEASDEAIASFVEMRSIPLKFDSSEHFSCNWRSPAQ